MLFVHGTVEKYNVTEQHLAFLLSRSRASADSVPIRNELQLEELER